MTEGCHPIESGTPLHQLRWSPSPCRGGVHGMLGRSQGCFAVGENELDRVFANLGPGRMIYARAS
jgi:hypothetical protein